MRIDGWHIDGYGVHADLGVNDLDGGLTIIAGPNESGKTTLQHFLVGMLFGFTAVNRPDHHPALRGGTYGGRLFVTDDDGQRLTIHRGARKSSLRVTHADGSPYEGDLADVLGGASKELFQSVFSVHLDDLAQLRALTEDQVRDRVFSAGILGAGRSAQVALTQLGGERDVLLKPNGRGERYRIKELRAQLAAARLRLDEAKRESSALPAHLRQLELLADRAGTLSADAEALRADLALVTAVTELWPRWSAATDARHQLDQIGTVPTLPADAPARLHTAIERHRAAADAATRAADELTGAEQHLASLDAPVLDTAAIDRIERLARQVDGERERARRIGELAARLDQQRIELDQDLAVLGGGRDLAWLEARPAGASDASGLRQAAAAVADARNEVRDATRAADQLATELAVEAADLDRAEAALADLPTLRPADATAGLDAANALAALATQREVAVRRLDDARARRDAALADATTSSGSPAALLAAAGVALVAGAALLALGQPTIGGALLALAAAVGTIGFVQRSRAATPAPTADLDAVIDLAADDVRRIDTDLAGPLATLRLDVVPSASDAAGIRAHAERVAASAQHADEQRTRVAADRAGLQDRTTRRTESAHRRSEAAHAQLQATEAAWGEWLAGHDLPLDLDPAGAAEFLSSIDRARGVARHLAVTESDLQAQRTAAAAFAAEVAELVGHLTQLGDLGEPDVDPVTVVDRLATRAAGQRALLLQIADGQATVERAGVAERRAGRARADAADALAIELHAIGATTVDDALATLDRVAAATELRAAIDDAEARLDAAAGSAEDRRTRALELLAAADPAAWADQTRTLRRRLAEATDDRDRCLHDQAAVRSEVDKLMTSADVPTCELRVSGIEAQLVEAVTTWASLSLAHQMVEGTLAKYQRERQPDVVKRAAALFTHVTGGDYVRLEVRDNDVFAIDHAEREVPAHLLSQGAREQLYLCMRVALAESFSKTTPLPLLLDDITVNADARRQQQLTDLLVTVSDTQQVFAFTCHDTVVDQLRQLRPEARVITLQAHRSVSGRTTRIGAVS
ncbi:MAG TPA: AAA family ATPase [Acidimicrobiales bacterium]|nr:AAA family ATPase [Acidimicrobiales bacterium]